ncbi:MAG: hypothetical protein J7621_29340 [Niastella sp.]|nr:hypothetical protein [Niastella sp.]
MKYLRILPFLAVCIILCYTWFTIATTDFSATWKHQLALGAAIVNLLIYFRNFKYGLIFTGVFLVLATFNFLGLLPEIAFTSYFVTIAGKEFSTPAIQTKSLLLLIGYLIVNTGYFINLYADWKYSKDSK